MKIKNAKDVKKAVDERGLLVTCPFCGQPHNRSRLADSYVICSRCGSEYYVFLEHDVMVTVPADRLEDSDYYVKLRNNLIGIKNM